MPTSQTSLEANKSSKIPVKLLWTFLFVISIAIFIQVFNHQGFIWNESGILGLLASVVLGLLSIGIAFHISQEQDKQMQSLAQLTEAQKQQITDLEKLNKNIDEHVLGTLRGFDRVLESLENLLEEANRQSNATVYFMAYWLWFGADKEFDKGLNEVTKHKSRVYSKLRSRIAGNHATTLVVYNDREKLKSFVQSLIKYKQNTSPNQTTIDENDVNKLLENYMTEITWLNNEVNSNPNIKANFRSEIPAIIFAIDGDSMAGIWYIGETAMLEQRSQLGGFMSRNPAMVGMLIDQVKHFAGQANA